MSPTQKSGKSGRITQPGKILVVAGIFAIAMGYMESAVVVYMREILYPMGFAFPLKPMALPLAVTELFREAATMVMLAAIGWIAARKGTLRFAIFLFAFAVWDIFYYVFLYLLLGWPSSLLEWDLLFLIPVAWTGPVLAPVINSATMILLTLVIVQADFRKGKPALLLREWALLITGSLITLLTYMLDPARHILATGRMWDPGQALVDYIPGSFNWWLFACGELLFVVCLAAYWRRTRRL